MTSIQNFIRFNYGRAGESKIQLVHADNSINQKEDKNPQSLVYTHSIMIHIYKCVSSNNVNTVSITLPGHVSLLNRSYALISSTQCKLLVG